MTDSHRHTSLLGCTQGGYLGCLSQEVDRLSNRCTGAAPRTGSASNEGGSRKRHDERPRDDAAKLGPYEGLQLVEETRSGRLFH